MFKLKSKSGNLLEISDIQAKLETLSSRFDHLESLSSSQNNNNGELEVVRTEQPSDVGKRQEQQVFTFLYYYFYLKKTFIKSIEKENNQSKNTKFINSNYF